MWRTLWVVGCLLAASPAASAAAETPPQPESEEADPLDGCVEVDPSATVPVTVNPQECLHGDGP